jgi:hypothetical protein
LNAYTTEFFANCPNNGLRIKYRLRIETRQVITVEQLITTVENLSDGYHEEIADELLAAFGGVQTLIADHHGVAIETTRAAKEPA